MRLVSALCLVAAAYAQTQPRQTTTYTYDVHGRRVEAARSSETRHDGASEAVQYGRTLGGRTAPLEKVEERVVREDGTGRVVERIVRRYSADGSPLPIEKIQIEQRKRPDGSTTVTNTVYRGDINGRLAAAERSTTQTRSFASGETAETVVERPSINGGFDVFEKSTSTTSKTPAGTRQELLTQRRADGGRFVDASRQITDTTEQNGQAVETTHMYDAWNGGPLQLSGQTVSRLRKNADGSDVREVAIYGVNVAGKTVAGQPQLREQHLVERRQAGNTTVESLSVSRPVQTDGRLGPYQKVSEKTCTGCSLSQ